MKTKGFIIAGTHSGVGKTTITLGVMAYLKSMGLNIQGFKVGPDFIDPGHHRKICGKSSHNLDTWMLKPWYNKRLFDHYSVGADINIIEGVMGIFDGFSPISDIGSTSHLAKVLNLPVILIVDASSMARSVAPLIKGFVEFDKEIKIEGIFFNRVGSISHIEIIKKCVQHYINIPCFGFFKKQKPIQLSSRHLGLVTAEEDIWNTHKINELINWTKDSVTDNFIEFVKKCTVSKKDIPPIKRIRTSTKIAVAKDRAFCFYYKNNLDILKYMGAELIFFSPLQDTKLPENIKGIYIGGGYPELYLDRLSKNVALMEEVKKFVEDYGVLYAECGGFMYLMDTISAEENITKNMVGIFPFNAHLKRNLVSLGYRKIELLEDCPIGPKGLHIRGHEFHYSVAEGIDNYPHNIYRVIARDGHIKKSHGVRYKNCIGSYIHLHFGSNLLCARYLIEWCKKN